MDTSRPLVSVVVLAYNHVNTIDQCLQGVLMQDYDGEIEVVLGEDESSDGTREQCIEWSDRYPNEIRLLLNKREDNIEINGKSTGTANFLKCFSKCQGKYIAFCEGDDYWLDAVKIKKQVDYFEANPDVDICYHRVMIERDGEIASDDDSVTEQRFSQIQDKDNIGLEAMIERGNFMHTPSVMLRREQLDLSLMMRYSAIGDYLNYLTVLSKGGRIAKLDGPAMAVYRLGSGTFTGQAYHLGLLDQLSCLTSALLLPLEEKHQEILLERSNAIRAELSRYCKELKTKEPSAKQMLRIVLNKFKRRLTRQS